MPGKEICKIVTRTPTLLPFPANTIYRGHRHLTAWSPSTGESKPMRAVSAEPTSSQPAALYVSSRLAVREAMSSTRGEQLSEGGEEFRLLTPEWYAWLRSRMEKARAAHQAGTLAAEAWEALRGQFNEIHRWAVARYGDEALRAAMGKLSKEQSGKKPGRQSANGHADPKPGIQPAPAPAPPTQTFRFPAHGNFRFFERVSPEAVAAVDAIRDQALALGWTLPLLYQNQGNLKFPCGPEWGLVSLLGEGKTLGEVTLRHIEIIYPGPRGSRSRYHNMNATGRSSNHGSNE